MTRGILVEKKIVLVFHAATFSHFTRGKKKKMNRLSSIERSSISYVRDTKFFFSVFDNNKIL